MSVFSRFSAATAAAVVVLSSLAGVSAQAQAPAQTSPFKVGDMAPDFTVTTVTADGVESKPFKLSEHRGETVILAFFPKARTSGCTMQMEAYRDKYADVFMGGKKVTLVGVSADPDTALTSWAKDAKFPFRFASDVDKKVGIAYGANAGTGRAHSRHLFVIDPTGKIAYIATPFLQMSADAYTALGTAVSHAGHSK